MGVRNLHSLWVSLHVQPSLVATAAYLSWQNLCQEETALTSSVWQTMAID